MLPSEKLRKLIEKIYQIDLEKYAWSEEFKKHIFSINLDELYEKYVKTMEEVYKCGYNIGHCGLTSRYLAINLKDALLHYGTCAILKGTKCSLNGNHAWITLDNVLIDTTLMLIIPLDKINEYGYTSNKIIAKESACILSEYDTFSKECKHLQDNALDYENSLFKISM